MSIVPPLTRDPYEQEHIEFRLNLSMFAAYALQELETGKIVEVGFILGKMPDEKRSAFTLLHEKLNPNPRARLDQIPMGSSLYPLSDKIPFGDWLELAKLSGFKDTKIVQDAKTGKKVEVSKNIHELRAFLDFMMMALEGVGMLLEYDHTDLLTETETRDAKAFCRALRGRSVAHS